MKASNFVETIVIRVCKQISLNHLKEEIIYELFTYKTYMYIHLNVCKQMTDIKLFLLHRNIWNYLIVWK